MNGFRKFLKDKLVIYKMNKLYKDANTMALNITKENREKYVFRPCAHACKNTT